MSDEKDVMSAEKREAAMRLFGALSEVDEQYLAECGRTEKVIPFYNKYGKAIAAVLVLFVLGAGYAGVSSMDRITGGKSTNNFSAAMPDEAADHFTEEKAEAAEEPAQNGFRQDNAAHDGTAQEGIVYEFLPDAWPENCSAKMYMETYGKTAATEAEINTDEAAGIGATANTDKAAGTGATANTDKAAGTGATANTDKAAGTGTETNADADRSKSHEEKQHTGQEPQRTEPRQYLRVVGSYEGTDQTFELQIIDLGDTVAGMPVTGAYYTSEDFDETCVRKEMEGGEGDFAVLYTSKGRYVLVRFTGSGSADEVWRMFDSIKQ